MNFEKSLDKFRLYGIIKTGMIPNIKRDHPDLSSVPSVPIGIYRYMRRRSDEIFWKEFAKKKFKKVF